MSVSKGNLAKSYVSAFSLDFPEIRKDVIDIYNEVRFTNMITRSGKKEPVKQWNFKTVYNDALFKQGDTTGATVTGSGTASVTTTTTVATSGFARQNDMVEFITSGKIGLVFSVTPSAGADTMVIKSVDGTNITHVAGEKLIIFSNAVGEDSDTTANLRYGLTSKVNKIQISREKSVITDVENASVLFVEWNGQAKYLVKDHLEKKLRMERSLDANYIKSEMSATSFEDSSPALVDPVGGGAIQTNRGLNKYIENDGGILDACATPGTFVQADLDGLCDLWNAARVPSDLTALCADGAKRKFDTWAKGLGSSGITSAKLEVNGTVFDYNVSKISYGRFNLQFSALPILDDPDLFGGSLPSKSMYFVPMEMKVKTQDDKTVPMLRTRYVKSQTKYGSDMVSEIHSGALNTVNPNGTKMEMATEWVTAQGLEMLAPQLATRMKVLS